jgi:hypothetical protein
MAMAFSSYCGLAIMHSLMYKKVADAQYRSKLSNELMMYHMKVHSPPLPSSGPPHTPAGPSTLLLLPAAPRPGAHSWRRGAWLLSP